jgi:hypothetical protein
VSTRAADALTTHPSLAQGNQRGTASQRPSMPAAPGPVLRSLRRNPQRAGLLRDLRGRHHPGPPLQTQPLTAHLQTASGRGTLPGLRGGAAKTPLLRDLWSRHHALAPVQRRTGHPRTSSRADPRLPGTGCSQMRPVWSAAASHLLRAVRDGHHTAARLPTRGRSTRLSAGGDDAPAVLQVRRTTARAPLLRAVRRRPDSGSSVRGLNVSLVSIRKSSAWG